MVEPYVYEFRTFAKERWFNKELMAVFTAEFGANTPQYYVRSTISLAGWLALFRR